MNLSEELRHEVTPKNILMIGPTGVAKTEIARRLAKLAQSDPSQPCLATAASAMAFSQRGVRSRYGLA